MAAKATRYECCAYCLWNGRIKADGTMWLHRVADAEDRYGHRKQNPDAEYCDGSGEPYMRFGDTTD